VTQRRGRRLAGWIEGGRRAGVFLLLLALCGGLGLLVSLPLWLFATTEPRIYTVAALALLAAGVLFLVVRAVQRRMKADPSRTARSFFSGLFSVLIAIFTLAGLYGVAVLLVRGLWILGVIYAVTDVIVVWLLTVVQRAVRKRRKGPPVPAENEGR